LTRYREKERNTILRENGEGDEDYKQGKARRKEI